MFHSYHFYLRVVPNLHTFAETVEQNCSRQQRYHGDANSLALNSYHFKVVRIRTRPKSYSAIYHGLIIKLVVSRGSIKSMNIHSVLSEKFIECRLIIFQNPRQFYAKCRAHCGKYPFFPIF